jgi:hypothetical protein
MVASHASANATRESLTYNEEANAELDSALTVYLSV